ncbi:hypothetical protein [Vibrio phage VP-HS15]|uniref:Uncharacterized protein n=1 Tax=Vibrio phage VP-HS15 TaxID=2686284 RepID=A0A6B9LK69_9CAUD|nr:hypothetical protein [Vibrio phage VP-HS15]
MSRKDNSIAQKVPVLTRLSEPAKVLTVEDLFNPEHPVNNSSESGKAAGMSVIIDGHTWVAEGSGASDSWYRLQKHVEQQRAILRTVGNTSSVSSDGSFTYQTAEVDSLLPVEPFLAGEWEISSNLVQLTYQGEECVFRFNLSGDVSTDDSQGTGDNIGVQIYDVSSGEGLTGATKIIPVAKVQGSSISISDFTLVGYARVKAGDVFRFEVTSDFSADLLVNNILLDIEPQDILLYL